MQESQSKSLSNSFVSYVIKKSSSDTAAKAAFARGDNPNTEYLVWEYLASWCDIADTRQRRAYALIAAAIARGQVSANGEMNVGECLRRAANDPSDLENAPEKAKLMRLISCDSPIEVVEYLRSIIRYLQAKEGARLDYAQTLDDIMWWGESCKIKWSKAFFNKSFSKLDNKEATKEDGQQKENE